jgi:DNA-binding MarR family transcriptional regulator
MSSDYSLTEIVEILTRTMGEMESKVLAGREFSALSMRQLHYLDVVHRLGHPTLSEVAREMDVSRPSATAAVAKLAAAGFVIKVTSDEDRRVAHVHLAGKGERIVRLHEEVHQAVADLFISALNRRELQELVRMMNKIVAGLKADRA